MATSHKTERRLLAIWGVADIYGGVQVLTARFADYLKIAKVPFVVIAKKGTRLAQELSWAPLVEPTELGRYTNEISHVFFPHVCTLKEALPWKDLADAKVYCLLVHPTEIFTSFFPCTSKLMEKFGFPVTWWIKSGLPRHNKRVSRLLETLLAGNGLATMDGATSRGLQYFYPTAGRHYAVIPIPSPVAPQEDALRTPSDRLSIGYFGRVDKFKLSALEPFVQHTLAQLRATEDIELHLVVEGHLTSRLIDVCRTMGFPAHYYGFQPPSRAKALLKAKTDFVVAMGTSALDIASGGHPCLIIDPAHAKKTRPQRKFRFVYELEEFTLGEFRDFPGYKEGLHTISDVIRYMRQDPTIGKKCARYVQENHNPRKSFDALMVGICNTTVVSSQISELSDALCRSYRSLDKTLRTIFLRPS